MLCESRETSVERMPRIKVIRRSIKSIGKDKTIVKICRQQSVVRGQLLKSDSTSQTRQFRVIKRSAQPRRNFGREETLNSSRNLSSGLKKSVRFSESDLKFLPLKVRCKSRNDYFTRRDLSPGRTLKIGQNYFDRNTFPMPSPVALQFFKKQLSLYERAEILEYSKVYFIGLECQKPTDCYFTDQNGYYNYVLGDQIRYRYEINDALGKGAFGAVMRCFDHKKNCYVAIKIMQRTPSKYRENEIQALDIINENDPRDLFGVVKSLKNFKFRGHLCIVFELLSINLQQFIDQHHSRQFAQTNIKSLTKQLFLALDFIHSNDIIHCDIKPDNILLKHPTKISVKIIDFGTSCINSETIFTYIQTRYYRAPEVVLGCSYSSKIDIWSLGCVLVETYTGKPLFKGQSEHELLAYIIQVLGTPPIDFIQTGVRFKDFFDTDFNFIPPQNWNQKASKPLTQILNGAKSEFVDIINSCLQWNPEQRISANQVLQHPWVSQSNRKRRFQRNSQGIKAQLLLKMERQVLEQAFRCCDFDGDGKIGIQDFKLTTEIQNDEDVEQLLQAIKQASGSQSNDKFLTLQEFINGVMDFPYILEQFNPEFQTLQEEVFESTEETDNLGTLFTQVCPQLYQIYKQVAVKSSPGKQLNGAEDDYMTVTTLLDNIGRCSDNDAMTRLCQIMAQLVNSTHAKIAQMQSDQQQINDQLFELQKEDEANRRRIDLLESTNNSLIDHIYELERDNKQKQMQQQAIINQKQSLERELNKYIDKEEQYMDNVNQIMSSIQNKENQIQNLQKEVRQLKSLQTISSLHAQNSSQLNPQQFQKIKLESINTRNSVSKNQNYYKSSSQTSLLFSQYTALQQKFDQQSINHSKEIKILTQQIQHLRTRLAQQNITTNTRESIDNQKSYSLAEEANLLGYALETENTDKSDVSTQTQYTQLTLMSIKIAEQIIQQNRESKSDRSRCCSFF